MTKLEDAKLKSILPSSISHDEKMRAAADSLQKWLTSIAKAGPDGQLWVDIGALSSLELDHLAWQFRADVWRDTWPMNIKRATIRNIIEDKRLKGTRWAVERAVEHLGSSVEIVEWWQVEPKAPHNTFDVVIDLNEIPGQASTEVQRDLRAAIDKAKPARELYQLILALKTEGVLGLYGAHRSMAICRIDGVGVETFDPLTLSPLVWLDPSDVATLFVDSAGTTPVLFSGDPVGLWKNKGTLGAVGDAAQPVSASRLVWTDAGGGRVEASGMQRLITQVQSLNYPVECWAVVEPLANVRSSYLSNRRVGTATSGVDAGISQNSHHTVAIRDAGPPVINSGYASGSTSAQGSRVVWFRIDRERIAVGQNVETEELTYDFGRQLLAQLGGPPLEVGTRGAEEQIQIGSVLIFDRMLTDGERVKLRTYLEAQHGI